MERLQKIIASSGYCSRRRAEELILLGKVAVNGIVVKKLGTRASFNDTITIDGKNIAAETKEYILLYKPRGVITSTSDDKGRKTVMDLIDSNKRLYPVGRLDYDTSGILILTNDGELTNFLIHPSKKIEKVYVAKIDSVVTKNSLNKLLKGITLDGKYTRADRIKIKRIDKKKNSSIVEITIHEGRYHQVKKMFNSVGYNVVSLKREKFAFLDLKGLKSGEYRYLSLKEVKTLYSLSK